MDKNDFSDLKKSWNISLNSSNQNFHNKVIHSLSESYKIDAISIIPFSKKYSSLKKIDQIDKEDGKITWHYLPQKHKKYFFGKEIKNLKLKIDKNTVVITDTINAKVLLNSFAFAKKHHLKVIGIYTDSPSNITSNKKIGSLITRHFSKKVDGAISLTVELNSLLNKKKKPYKVIHGIVETQTISKDQSMSKYIFYGGSLLEKDGIYHFINGFNKLENKDIKLFIAGHHENKEKINEFIEKNHNIIFLGNVDEDMVKKYIENAIMCVNPRPIDARRDALSFPSKVLEYINGESIVLSTKQSSIFEMFNREIVWMNDLSERSIVNAINHVLQIDQKTSDEMKQTAKAKVQEHCSFKCMNKAIAELLNLLISE